MGTQGMRAIMEEPMSVEQIVEKIGSIYDDRVPLVRWLRSAETLFSQAETYDREGENQMAYFLYYRHAQLILNELPRHPDARNPKHKQSWDIAKRNMTKSVKKMELLKPRINERYKKIVQQRADRMMQRNSSLVKNSGKERMSPAPAVGEERLQASEHRDYAVQMANWTIDRRVSRQYGDSQSVNEEIAQIGNRIRRQHSSDHSDRTPARQGSYAVNYSYPHVPVNTGSVMHTRSPQYKGAPATTNQEQPSYTRHAPALPPKQPSLPPKEALPSLTQRQEPPLIPTKSTGSPPPRPSKVLADMPPSPPASSSEDEATHQFAPAAYLENDTPLRTVFLPSPLQENFLRLASKNTSRNLETLGLLCGHLLQNAFFITTLLIPKQTSTSDTCEMVDEEGVYAYIDSHSPPGSDLLVLGWIHTHPSQTCFLSSRDLHTHVWFQVSLPESIAVVCAPSKPKPYDYGVFRLTDPPGMGAIKSCKLEGVFHPHDSVGGDLYVGCSGRPGHVVEHPQLRFEVVDLRQNE